ncbi:expressed unknown protein [Seminavis robusta]|uniref:Uncharacterized protein n=1 Tax=Seminavis robusta TaxID=568900 RepID=A0A9N8H5B6_9STRA|nr:expressed unknown protein [Seminavis robusta]|eukprot:Sro70_g038990.1 n/a (423) ;mRNA; r:78751-80019
MDETTDKSNALTEERTYLEAVFLDGEVHVSKGDESLIGGASRVLIHLESNAIDLSLEQEGGALVSFLADWKLLKDLHFLRDWDDDACDLPVATLAELFRRGSAANLSILSCGQNVLTAGTAEEFISLVKTIQQCTPCLKVLELPTIRIRDSTQLTADTRGFLDPLLPLLVEGSELCRLGYRPHFVTERGIEAVFASSRLKELHLCAHAWPKEIAAAAMRCLAENRTVTTFDIVCSEISAETSAAICQALERNETLQTFELWSWESVERDKTIQILKSLTVSRLKSFTFKCHGCLPLCSGLLSIVEQVLEKNVHLEKFDVWCSDCLPREAEEVFDFWLALNARTQRASLLENPLNHEKWVKALIQSKCDVASSFYLLSENPVLIAQLMHRPCKTVQPVIAKRKRLYRRAQHCEMKRFKCSAAG